MNSNNNLLNQPGSNQQKPNALLIIVILSIIAGICGYLIETRKGKDISQITPKVTFQPSAILTTQSNMSSQSAEHWKVYVNQKYSYQVQYPPDKSYSEKSASDYEITDFLFGCFSIFVVPYNFDGKNLDRKPGIPWTKLNELENAITGSINNYQIDEWKIENKEPFTLLYSFKKLPIQEIGGVSWNAFKVTNNFENNTEQNIYFTRKNNMIYILNVHSYGPCYDDKSSQILSTFSFKNSPHQTP